MHDDTITVANKIISRDVLFEIFTEMQKKLDQCLRISSDEELQNERIDYKYQKWTFRDSESKLNFDIDFYDGTSIKYDKYDDFIRVFDSRLREIKNIYAFLVLNYSTQEEEQQGKYHSQTISLRISETKIDTIISLDSSDAKMEDTYEFIRDKTSNAPEKYDEVIKKKGSIYAIVGLTIGLIPGIIISTLLLLVPAVRDIFVNGYVVYPFCVVALAFVVGGTIAASKLDKMYKNIIPGRKFVGYDSGGKSSVYKDDIDEYVETSEVLIGKSADNLKLRQSIMETYGKHKKRLPAELIALVLFSVIILFFR